MKSYQAHEDEAVVRPDGAVRVEGVPFAAGDRVRVMVFGAAPGTPRCHSREEIERSQAIRQRLQGSVVRYDDPSEPAVSDVEWDALR